MREGKFSYPDFWASGVHFVYMLIELFWVLSGPRGHMWIIFCIQQIEGNPVRWWNSAIFTWKWYDFHFLHIGHNRNILFIFRILDVFRENTLQVTIHCWHRFLQPSKFLLIYMYMIYNKYNLWHTNISMIYLLNISTEFIGKMNMLWNIHPSRYYRWISNLVSLREYKFQQYQLA